MSDRLSVEETDLKTHVEMCAMRHRAILEQIGDLRGAADRRLTRMERVLWGVLTLLTTSMGVAAAEVIPLLRLLGGP